MSSTALSNPRLRQFIINLKFQCSRVSGYGVFGITKRILRKIVTIIFAIVLLPFSIVLYYAGFRRLLIFTDRIGHLAIEPDTLLKAQSLGLIKQQRWFVLAPKHRVANQHLLQYWQNYFSVYHSNLSCFFLNCVSLWPFMRYDASRFINNKGSQFTYEVNRLWGDRPPVLRLTNADKSFGDAQLDLLGIPKDAWFVCVHAREGGFSSIDESLHCHRNGKINNLIPAIEEIIRRGGWVVRIGDPSMAPLKVIPQVIDYAHHPMRCERLDIVLCASARFILGNTSGIFAVGSIFGVPVALANMIPMPTMGFCYHDLSIPKLYRNSKTTQFLSFKEVMISPISTFRLANLYEKCNLIVEENTPEDILALTLEMMARLDGEFVESAGDVQLRSRYMALFQHGHYSYGAISRICIGFLRKYQYLL